MAGQAVILNFDATQVDPKQSKGGVLLPLAEYPVEITDIAAVAVKDQQNKGFLEITLKVLDGQYKGVEQTDRLNMYGQAETPTRIAYQRLSAYAHIAGKLRVASSAELIGTKLIALIGPQDAPNDKYSEVKSVKDLAGNAPVLGQASAPQNTPIPMQQQQQQQQVQGGGFPVQNVPAQGTPFDAGQQPSFGQQPAQAQFSNPAPTGQQPQFGAAATTGGNPPWVK